MGLLDHFHPPLAADHHCESFHSNWATRIADALNERWLPEESIAEEFTHSGMHLEMDVATFEVAEQSVPRETDESAPGGAPVAVAPAWAPPMAPWTLPATFPDTFEVRVYQTTSGRTLVAAVELVSPGNKDRPEERRAFVAKCLSYLSQGVSLAVVDIVTNRRANLHNELMQAMEHAGGCRFSDGDTLYAVAYRPVERHEEPQIDIWPESLAVGQPLPTLPLRLTGDLFVPVELDATYEEACRRDVTGPGVAVQSADEN